jgi:hypothetical protein
MGKASMQGNKELAAKIFEAIAIIA